MSISNGVKKVADNCFGNENDSLIILKVNDDAYFAVLQRYDT
jgi:hypothetical protein